MMLNSPLDSKEGWGQEHPSWWLEKEFRALGENKK
jgi:hypothetical protein